MFFQLVSSKMNWIKCSAEKWKTSDSLLKYTSSLFLIFLSLFLWLFFLSNFLIFCFKVPYRKVVIEYLNVVFGSGQEGHVWWRTRLPPLLKTFFFLKWFPFEGKNETTQDWRAEVCDDFVKKHEISKRKVFPDGEVLLNFIDSGVFSLSWKRKGNALQKNRFSLSLLSFFSNSWLIRICSEIDRAAVHKGCAQEIQWPFQMELQRAAWPAWLDWHGRSRERHGHRLHLPGVCAMEREIKRNNLLE